MGNKHLPIVKVDYGVSSNYGSFIEINRKLDYYPNLKKKILDHELRHSEGKYTFQDLLNDFNSKDSSFYEGLKFAVTNKESIVNYFPFMYSYHGKQFAYNSSSLPPFIVLGIIFTLFFKLIVHLPLLHLIIGWISGVLVLNGIFMLITHSYVKSIYKKRLNENNQKNITNTYVRKQ